MYIYIYIITTTSFALSLFRVLFLSLAFSMTKHLQLSDRARGIVCERRHALPCNSAEQLQHAWQHSLQVQFHVHRA